MIRLVLFATFLAAGCRFALLALPDRTSETPERDRSQIGVASYYADMYHGRPTASGEIFDMHQLTAAHRNYPFGTVVRVTHLSNDRSVIVRINDRGPFVSGRIIDLSLTAARRLDMLHEGIAEVKVEVITEGRTLSDTAFPTRSYTLSRPAEPSTNQ